METKEGIGTMTEFPEVQALIMTIANHLESHEKESSDNFDKTSIIIFGCYLSLPQLSLDKLQHELKV